MLLSSEALIAKEESFGARNYHPLPVVLERGKGVFVWDVEGKRYFDFLSAYSAVNQGHCHPRLVETMKVQAEKLTLTSRAFYNSQLGIYEEFITNLFGFDKVLPMNSGAEGVETALKVCRKWAYECKGVPEDKAEIIVCRDNFHGRTITIVSFSVDPTSKKGFGPFAPGFITIPYNDCEALEMVLKTRPNIAGFLVEPIQGEAGVNVPDEGFLKNSKALCEQYNVLFIADEIQTGIARTGKLLAVDYENVQPDILILGKALSGGFYPISAVLADNSVMDVIKPGEHGSTFGGNPMACAIAREALKIVEDEKLIENSFIMGGLFRQEMQKLIDASPLLHSIRGKGLLNALLTNSDEESPLAWNICLELKARGLLAKPTHGNKIRFAPPLVITTEQIKEAVNIIKNSVEAVKV